MNAIFVNEWFWAAIIGFFALMIVAGLIWLNKWQHPEIYQNGRKENWWTLQMENQKNKGRKMPATPDPR